VDRAGIRRLEELARAKAFDLLLVYKIDRLSRRRATFHRLLEIFAEHGIGLVSLTQPIDTTTATGRLMTGMLIEFAAFEAETIAERVRDNLAHLAAQGRWTGGRRPPTGYSYNLSTKRLEVHEGEAVTVRLLFETFAATDSIAATARQLNLAGVPPTEAPSWDGQIVLRMLRSPWVAGFVSWGKRQQIPGKGFAKRRPRSEHLVEPGLHEAIIDPAVWRQVQARLDANPDPIGDRSRKPRPWLSVLRCGACGGRMGASTRRITSGSSTYYRCDAKAFGKPCGGSSNVTALYLESVVLRQLSDLWDRYGHEAPAKPRPSAAAKRDPSRAIASLQAQVDRARELYVAGEWDRSTFQTRKAALEKRMAEMASPVDADAVWEPLPVGLAARWAALTMASQKAALAKFVDMAMVELGQVRVLLTDRPEPDYPTELVVPIRRVYTMPPGKPFPKGPDARRPKA
jgi:DNA invertase Pin-like site-specific DNA recombinase